MVAPALPSASARDTQRLLDLLNALGSTTFRQLLWQRASELDLTYAQSQVLFHVADHPGCHMGDVAKAFGVTLPAVTHIVDRLEEKEFLAARRRSGRPSRLHPRADAGGAALVQELHGVQMRGVEAVLRRMEADDRQRVIKGLEALVDAAAEAAKSEVRLPAWRARRRPSLGLAGCSESPPVARQARPARPGGAGRHRHRRGSGRAGAGHHRGQRCRRTRRSA